LPSIGEAEGEAIRAFSPSVTACAVPATSSEGAVLFPAHLHNFSSATPLHISLLYSIMLKLDFNKG
ncbi:MAG: hypothetical protein IJY96_01300, partial [Oscillospiraceae bacterium]|nr:hypothetical protein [Oscillospiraceae bacterium]